MDRSPLEVYSQPEIKAIACALGVVAMCAVEVEKAATNLYTALLGSEAARIVASGQTLQQIKQGCIALVDKGPFVPGRGAIRAALDRAATAYEQRNKVVHAEWLFRTSDLSDAIAIRSKRWATHDFTHWTTESLEDLAIELLGAAEELARCADLVERGLD